MKYLILLSIFGLALAGGRGRSSKVSSGEEDDLQVSQRQGKFLPVFNLIKFANEQCSSGGNGKNGTCYTKEECDSRDGTASGTCAQGYGVCCIFSLSCGQQTSENCTYLAETSVTSTNPDPCTYTICKSSPDVCRIKFDFMSFDIAAPTAGTATAIGAGAAVTNSDVIGDCTTDTFTIASPGNVGSPVICGVNTGQHMIVDASSNCVTATFNLGANSMDSRNWNIKVTQYTKADSDIAGSDGCLQWYTGSTGTIASFNYPVGATALTTAATHLSNQNYDICIRRESGMCAICYIPTITTANANNAINSFGLSVSTATTVVGSMLGVNCVADYVIIPNAQAHPVTPGTFPAAGFPDDRICGRAFNLGTTDATRVVPTSICTQAVPFKVSFVSDATEATVGNAADNANTNEQNGAPAGIIGFSLNYAQQSC